MYPGVYNLLCPITAHQISRCLKDVNYDTTVVFDVYFAEGNDQDLNDKIGEFVYDKDLETLDLSDLTIKSGGWKLHRVRSDKNDPNNIKVVLNTLDSVINSLTKEELLDYETTLRNNWKSREIKQVSR